MSEEEAVEPSLGAAHAGVPRWVKVFGLVVIGLVVLAVVLMLVNGGEHGPGRHLPSAAPTMAVLHG